MLLKKICKTLPLLFKQNRKMEYNKVKMECDKKEVYFFM